MSETANTRLETARQLLRAGDVGAARAAYEAMIDAEPGYIDALIELGHLEREAGLYERAATLHRDAVARTPTAANWTALGRTLGDAGLAQEAAEAFADAIRVDRSYAAAHLHLGELQGATGQLAEAQQSFETAIALDPQDYYGHHNLGICAQLRNDVANATAHFRAALKINPKYWRSWQALGDIYRQVGEFASALACYEQLVTLQSNADNLLRLGATRQLLGDYDAAIDAYSRILAVEPNNTDALYNLGTCYQATGQLNEAASLLRGVLDSNPGNHSAAAALAGVYDKRGDYEKGLTLLRPLVPTAGANAEVWVSLGRLVRNAGAPESAIDDIEQALQQQPFSPVDRSRVAFTAGALRDANGDFDQAFDHFRLANELKPHSYQHDIFEQGVNQLIETFDASFFARFGDGVSDDQRPVFVVGMPRCGSTLVERILAAHPRLVTIGESQMLSGLAFKLGAPADPYPGCLGSVSRDALEKVAQAYLAALPAEGDRVVDKMLSNVVHIGLISMLYRNAHVIHCTRHPLDVALSCYSHDFSGTQVGFAYDLDDIAHYYRQYRRLISHWHRAAAVPILDIAYEDVVTDTQATTHRMLEFLGLPYNEQCLRFYEQDALANTASYAQVRRPVYRDALGRHRHYERQLQPVANALREFLD